MTIFELVKVLDPDREGDFLMVRAEDVAKYAPVEVADDPDKEGDFLVVRADEPQPEATEPRRGPGRPRKVVEA